jgi:peptide deformylase
MTNNFQDGKIVVRFGETPKPTPIPTRVLDFVKQTDPVLHEPCADAPVGRLFINDNQSLVECMLQATRKMKGYGLSANQLGVSRRLFVVDFPDPALEDQAYFNPEIISTSTETDIMEEGCLSLPFILYKIKRPRWVILKWQNIDGDFKQKTFHGITARVICHEMDHLSGKTLFDHMSNLEARRARERQLQALKRAKRRAE